MRNNVVKGTIGMLISALATVCFGQKVEGVTVQKVGEGVLVSIKGNDLGKPKESRVNRGRSYILEFNASMSGRSKRTKVSAGGLDFVQVGWYKPRPPKVHVLMHMDSGQSPKLTKTATGWTVSLNTEAPVAHETAPKVSQTKADAFPDRVPPIAAKVDPYASAIQNLKPVMAPSAARVTLDFVNTDIVQILKALAMQANVNIVTSPDVVGKVTVSLQNVTVSDALDLVTTMVGLRYSKVQDTYVVTSASHFSDIMQQIGGSIDNNSETRVVPIFSGEGSQIKAAVLKTVPPSTLRGRYDLVLPSDKVSVEQKTNLDPAKTGKDGQTQGDGGGTQVQTSTVAQENTTPRRDDYVILLGTPARLNDVERSVREIDSKICSAMGVKIPETTGTIQRIYEPKGLAAEDLVTTVRADKSNSMGNVQLIATPKSSLSKQVVVISGRENEVDNAYALLNSLDSLSDGGPLDYEVVGLKHVRPQVMLVQVMEAVPGLKVGLLPAPIDPNVGIKYTEEASGAKADQDNGTQGGGASTSGSGTSGSGSSGSAGSGSGSSGSGSSGQGNGLGASSRTTSSEDSSKTKAPISSFSIPMKLLLRGSKDQIDRAKRYIAMVDLMPKQVAIELRVMELSREDALQVGLDWSLLTGGSLRSVRVNQGLGTDSEAGGINTALGFKGGATASIIGKLDALSTNNRLIARPNILASDGVATRIFVGDEVRYIESITNSQNGPSITTAQVDVGVTFDVVARVGDQGNITLDLRPILSILQGFTPVPGGGNLPQTSKRMAESIVNMTSGETIAIGGLIQDQDRKTYGGIPILKDLPLIGRLFGRTNNSRTRSEVVFFVTVREVNNDNRADAADPRTNAKNEKPPK